jgi:hypothetical protein
MSTKMHTTNIKEELLRFLSGSSDGAGISNREFDNKITEFHRELGEKEEFSDMENSNSSYSKQLDALMADYLLSEYDKIGVSTEDKVYGFKGDTKVELMDGGGSTKMFIESMHFTEK